MQLSDGSVIVTISLFAIDPSRLHDLHVKLYFRITLFFLFFFIVASRPLEYETKIGHGDGDRVNGRSARPG